MTGFVFCCSGGAVYCASAAGFFQKLAVGHSGSAPAGFAHLTDFVFGAIAEFFQTVSDVACTAVVAFSKLFSDRAKQKYSANNPFYHDFSSFFGKFPLLIKLYNKDGTKAVCVKFFMYTC